MAQLPLGETVNVFWWQRWEILREKIEETAQLDPTGGHFRSLLHNLSSFGSAQFRYFYQGFGGKIPDNSLDPGKTRLLHDPLVQPNYILRWIIDRIAHDYELIRKAMWQRRYGTSSERKTLAVADSWGQALTSEVKSWFLDEEYPVVITYFDHKPRIDIVPYANVALIGIPHTVKTGSMRDLLVLPHELGHYVFWFGRIGGRYIRHFLPVSFRDELPAVRNWLKEIYADVFGFIVSGQWAVISFSFDMIFDNAYKQITKDQKTHPVDLIRPVVYLQTFVHIAQQLNIDVSDIKEHLFLPKYRQFIRDAGGPTALKTLDFHGDEQNVTLETFEEIFGRAVTKITGAFVPNTYVKFATSSIPGTQPNDDTSQRIDNPQTRNVDGPKDSDLAATDISRGVLLEWWTEFAEESLWNDFENLLEGLSRTDLATDSSIDPTGEESDTDGQPQIHQYKSTANFEEIRDMESGRLVEPEVWLTIFRADGWITEGPETRPSGGWEGSHSNS